MPKTQTILSVFVASPSDVDDERAALEQVIRELNDTWANNLNIRLELIHWKSHALPGISTDPQSVINETLSNDYDIFIGLAWTRLGTRTPRGESGTAEEFDRAYDRYQKDPGKIRIMFYFKTSPISTDIDLDQFTRLRNFRDKIGKVALYSQFSDVDDFKNLVRVHLTRLVQSWGNTWGVDRKPVQESTREPTSAITSETKSDDDDDIGYLDGIEMSSDYFAKGQEALQQIVSATSDIGDKVKAQAEKINSFRLNDRASVALSKRVINQIAEDMQNYAERITAETPIYSTSVEKGMNMYVKAVTLLPYFETHDYSELEASLKQLRLMRTSVETATASNSELRNSIAQIPPATRELSKAKKQALGALDRLIREFLRTIELIPAIESALLDIVQSASQQPKPDSENKKN